MSLTINNQSLMIYSLFELLSKQKSKLSFILKPAKSRVFFIFFKITSQMI